MPRKRNQPSFFQKISALTSRQKLGGIIFLAGLILLVIFSFSKLDGFCHQETSCINEPIKTIDEQQLIDGVPIRIVIPKVSIDLPVKEAKIEDGNWEVHEDAASFFNVSAKIGQEGNTVIYAHAKRHLFGPLKRIGKKDQVYVLTNSGWAVYEVVKTETVPPTEVEVVYPTEEKTLTLYTCINFLDKDRLVVSAKLVDFSRN